jgi:hypothetical protein
MRHPIALAALATSTTVLVAALRDVRPAMFFFAFGIACFALAGLVRDAALPHTYGPLFWVTAGAVQLAAFGMIEPSRPTDPVLGLLVVLGTGYLVLGTIAWLRARFS